MKLHEELEIANQTKAKLNKYLGKAHDDKQELMGINFALSNELAKLKVTLASPLNAPKIHKGNLLYSQELNSSMIAVMNVHQSILKDSDDSNELSPAPSPLPERVNLNTQKDKLLSTMGSTTSSKQPKLAIPRLDLSKAKQIQEINAKKGTQQALAGNKEINTDPKILDKLRVLEKELETTKKLLQREMFNNKDLSETISELQKTNTCLLYTSPSPRDQA
eukprot:TRINITY_DN23755_c0_g1_i2.p1 TRINITY_DN23755_c0_g1~~TRINITY_DN23755_c0_g1_i2.p1  ORF type:complete len:220 (-),score=29.53 TRINITY_DN23755_c0_g1_i2:34-693(-)